MNPCGYERYSRQIPVIGPQGQERLSEASVLIAGLGGLGCPVALYLAAAGIGRLILVDRDFVEKGDLNRQVLHWTRDIGRPKAASAAEKLSALNPCTEIDAAVTSITANVVERLVAAADVVVDALDNWEARMLLNSVCVRLGKPLVHAAVQGAYGQLTVVYPGRGPCLRCIFSKPRSKKRVAVLGPAAGVLASLQAMEVIKLVTGCGEPLVGKILFYDGWRCRFTVLSVDRSKSCPVCGRQR